MYMYTVLMCYEASEVDTFFFTWRVIEETCGGGKGGVEDYA